MAEQQEHAEREESKRALTEAKRQEEEERKRRLDVIQASETRARADSKLAFQKAKEAEEAARKVALVETPKEVFEAGRHAVRSHHRLANVAAKIVARGPGLQSGVLGERTTFEVLHKDEHGVVIEIEDDLQVQFFGPAQISGDFEEAEAGRYALSFVPPKPGDYDVHVMLQTVHVPGSPFRLKVASK